MKIVNNDLIIRDVTADDSKQLATWWNDGQVMAHAGFPLGLGISEKEIEESLSKDDDKHRRLIILKDEVPIGEMNYREKSDEEVEIGIKICDPIYQNQGIGKIVLSMLIEELFKKYHKISLDTNLNNTRAQHVYEQLGFIKKGVRHDSWVDQLGEKQSAVDYELYLDNFNKVG